MESRPPLSLPTTRGWIYVMLLAGGVLVGQLAWFWMQTPTALRVLGGLFALVLVAPAVRQLVRPLPFVTLTPHGIAFPFRRIQEIPWGRLLDVRTGPRTLRRGNATTLLTRPPIVLCLAADAAAPSGIWDAHAAEKVTLPDGTVQQLVDTAMCPISTEALIAEIGKWHPVVGARHLSAEPDAFTLASRPAGSRRNQRIGAVVFICLGALFLAFGARLASRLITSASWPAVDAVVTASRMREHSARGGPTYSPEIAYRYEVAGRTYLGTRFAMSYHSSAAAVSAIVSRYPSGAHVTAYYNPQDPGDAILEHAALWLCVALLGFGAAAIVAGGLLLRWRPGGEEAAAPA